MSSLSRRLLHSVMPTDRHCADDIGHSLVDSLTIPTTPLDTLFLILLFSSVCTWLGGNLLYLNSHVALQSGLITLACLTVILFFYVVSHVTKSIGWGIVVSYGLLYLLAHYHPTWLILIFRVIGIVALFFALARLRTPRRYVLPALMLGGITAFVMFSGQRYTTFNMFERLSAGTVHQDTLFHASIAAMIKTYGIASTGLDGLVPIAYYVLSHTLFAAVSVLSSVSVIETYGVANWVLFGPLLIFAIVACTVALDSTRRINILLAWGTTCILLVAIPVTLSTFAAVWNSFFVSESDLVALGLFAFGLPLLFKSKLQWADLFLVLALAVFMTAAKATVGIVYAGLWGTRFVFIGQAKRNFSLAIAALTSASVIITLLNTSATSAESIGIGPFDFIRYSWIGQHLSPYGAYLIQQAGLHGYSLFSVATWGFGIAALVFVIPFFIFHFATTWALIAWTGIARGWRRIHKSPAAVYALASFMAGALVVALFKIPGGSAGYVTNIALFVALPFIVATVSTVRWNNRPTLPTVLGCLLLLSAILSITMNRNVFRRHWLVQTKTNALVGSLSAIRHTAAENSVFFLSPDAKLKNPISRCTAQPFLYPAVSERAWVGVIPDNSSCKYKYYGYGDYGVTATPEIVAIKPVIPKRANKIDWLEPLRAKN